MKRVFLGFLVILALPVASLGKEAAVGTVAALEGDVRLRHAGEIQFAPVHPHQAVFRGDRFRTGDDGKVQLVFEDDSVVVLGTGSELEITEYLYRKGASERNVLLALLQGKLRFLVTRFFLERKEDFRIQTSQAVVGVRGTEGIVRILNPTVVYGRSGARVVRNPSTGELKDLGPLNKAWVERGQPIVVAPIDPADIRGLRAEFQIGSRSTGTPPPPSIRKFPLRDEPLTQDGIQEIIPKDIPEPERPLRPKYP